MRFKSAKKLERCALIVTTLYLVALHGLIACIFVFNYRFWEVEPIDYVELSNLLKISPHICSYMLLTGAYWVFLLVAQLLISCFCCASDCCCGNKSKQKTDRVTSNFYYEKQEFAGHRRADSN